MWDLVLTSSWPWAAPFPCLDSLTCEIDLELPAPPKPWSWGPQQLGGTPNHRAVLRVCPSGLTQGLEPGWADAGPLTGCAWERGSGSQWARVPYPSASPRLPLRPSMPWAGEAPSADSTTASRRTKVTAAPSLSYGTKGPVGAGAHGRFYGSLTERPNSSPALSGCGQGRGSRIPLAGPPDTPLSPTQLGCPQVGVGIQFRPSHVTLQQGPAPRSQPTRGRLLLPTPCPARHPCNLIPASQASRPGLDLGFCCRLGGQARLLPTPAWGRRVAVPSLYPRNLILPFSLPSWIAVVDDLFPGPSQAASPS